MWQQIIIAILTSGAVTGIFQLILNAAIKHKFDLELLRATKDLELKASERNIKLTSTFELQRQTIETLYGGIIRLNQAISNLGKSLWTETVEEKAKIVAEAKNKFILDFYPKAIYLPQDVMENIGRLARAASILGKTYNEVARLEQQVPRTNHSLQSANAMLEKVPELEKNLENSIDTVINDFHRLLGIQTRTAEAMPEIEQRSE